MNLMMIFKKIIANVMKNIINKEMIKKHQEISNK